MLKRIAALLIPIMLVSGCGATMKVGETLTITPAVPPTSVASPNFAIYPAVYRVTGFVQGATLNLVYTMYNDLDFPSPANVVISLPSYISLQSNKDFLSWDRTTAYCQVVADNSPIPAKSSKAITIKVFVPADDTTCPSNWIFYVAYQSEGHKWGAYQETSNGNFVFYPGGFDCHVTDTSQIISWLTWGNSSELMVRRSYDNPPQTVNDGDSVYQGFGSQIILKWLNPETDQVLDRQYTQFNISDTQKLQASGGSNVFYRAWIKHLEYGVWDGTWDAIGQSVVIPEVQAKVLISK